LDQINELLFFIIIAIYMQKIAKISKNKANKKAMYRSMYHNYIFIKLLNKKST